jgi:hypothetical protein
LLYSIPVRRTSPDNKPLAGHKAVLLLAGQQVAEVETGPNGWLLPVELPDGKYDVRISGDGYPDAEVEFDTEAYNPFPPGLADAEHDEWLMEQAALRALARLPASPVEKIVERIVEVQAALDARPEPLRDEPMDYGSAEAEGEIPPDLAVLMEADETLDAARARFYAEYQRLRSLFVGNLYMDDAMLDRWKRLGAKASRAWLKITD